MATLADFVSSTINEIVEGVVSAQISVAPRGARVNPRGAMIGRAVLESSLHDGTTNMLIDMIEFDLSVTAESETKTKGTIGIIVSVIGLGAQGSSSETTAHQNRIRFRIPLQLPQHNQ